FFQEEAEFVIGDPTEMPRPQAKKTAYVGELSDGQSLGYWLLVLATPFRGRAIPFHFVLYSSKIIGAQATSRNQEHFRAFAQIKPWLGERPLVLDREFSYLELLQNLVVEHIHFIIRLKVGLPQVNLIDAQGQPLKLIAQPNQTVIYRQVWYKGLVPVNVIGLWRPGFQTPLWVMTDLEPEKGLAIYLRRMKIEMD
ncbi:MAG: transposase, partial [Anaerolineales bacterium]